MNILFLDESIQTGARGEMGQLVGVGVLILEENVLRALHDEVDATCQDFGVPSGCELKWSPSRKNWIHSNLVDEDRQECYRRILDVTSNRGARVLAVVFDTGRTSVKGSTALRQALDYAFERATIHLENEGQLGLIVADRPGGGRKEENTFLRDVLKTIESGTEFVPAKQIPINILTTPSSLVRHLQLADLVIGITTAMVAGATDFAGPLFSIVKEMFIKNTFGYIGGTGLKLFPNELTNLYHWILREDTFCRVGMKSGWTLPWPEWPYFYDGRDPSPGVKTGQD